MLSGRHCLQFFSVRDPISLVLMNLADLLGVDKTNVVANGKLVSALKALSAGNSLINLVRRRLLN